MRYLLLLFTLVFIGCTSTTPESQFAQHGICFTCPEGWNLLDRGTLGSNYGFEVGCYASNDAWLGEFEVAIVDSFDYPAEAHRIEQIPLQELLGKKSHWERGRNAENFKLTEEEITFKGMPAWKANFDFNVGAREMYMSYIVFQCGPRFIVMNQIDLRSADSKSRPGLEAILGSFDCCTAKEN